MRYSELTPEAQEKAREWMRDCIAQDNYWYEDTIGDIKDIGASIGISIEEVYFSGFGSQGDGACFVGTYSYKRKPVNVVDGSLASVIRDLGIVQRPNFYGLSAKVTHTGRYSHEYSTTIDVWRYSHEYSTTIDVWNRHGSSANDPAVSGITEALRDFMRWSYRLLEDEYNYQTSDEHIMAVIEDNDYDFDAEGL